MTTQPPEAAVQVLVAVATFRRPELLEALLPALVEQAEALDRPAAVLVVDNDPAESARGVVERSAGTAYEVEAQPGIAAARNRALDVASLMGVAAVVFIDDDETPSPEWLQTLVDAWADWGVAAVAGPVLSHFAGEVDPWVAAAPTFRRPRRTTGQSLGGAATNNLILSTAVLDRHQLRFDDAFGLTGGSDTMLTHTLVARGEEIRWCDEAVMHETVPADRATRAWVLRRTNRTGNVWSRVALVLAEQRGRRRRERVDLVLRGVWRIVTGCRRRLVGRLARDLELRVQGECDVSAGRGAIRGATGRVVTEYVRNA